MTLRGNRLEGGGAIKVPVSWLGSEHDDGQNREYQLAARLGKHAVNSYSNCLLVR